MDRLKAEMAALLRRPSKANYDVEAFANDLQRLAKQIRDRVDRLLGKDFVTVMLK